MAVGWEVCGPKPSPVYPGRMKFSLGLRTLYGHKASKASLAKRCRDFLQQQIHGFIFPISLFPMVSCHCHVISRHDMSLPRYVVSCHAQTFVYLKLGSNNANEGGCGKTRVGRDFFCELIICEAIFCVLIFREASFFCVPIVCEARFLFVY